jgi:hypothetical protein
MNDKIPRHVDDAIAKGLSMLPAQMDTEQARVMLYAIGLQESGFENRFQVVQGKPDAKGPARGYWQFERGGGVRGVMDHRSTEKHAERICHIRGVPFKTEAVWHALEIDDVLAACFARLLLWTDGNSLPKVSDQHGGWECYLRNWRPGKPHESRWFDNHAMAVLHVGRQK